MIDIKNLKNLSEFDLKKLFHRFGDDFTRIMVETVVPIVNDVKDKGDDALRKYTEKFDRVSMDNFFATEEEIERGYNNTPEDVKEAFKQAIENIREFHSHQKRENIHYKRSNGSELGVIFDPIERAAIYAPGGKAFYPSSVMMGVIPAQVAGVKDIILITPPKADGSLSDSVLFVAKMLGVKKILKAGGAQALAAVAFGTETVPKVDIICGPGNVFVTAAKSYLFSLGLVQIDSMAGPSEVLIIADKDANPKWTAWDMLSQAEHDEMAMAVLLTTSNELAEKVKEHIIEDIESGRGRHDIKKSAISKNSVILTCDSIEEAIDFSNKFGPEHMQMLVKEPMKYLNNIKNVGSLFLGNYAPVAVGDYFSGTNHVLPTGGATRFASGLSVETFMRRTTFQFMTEEALREAKEPVDIMSKMEGFDDKHGGSVDIRFYKGV